MALPTHLTYFKSVLSLLSEIDPPEEPRLTVSHAHVSEVEQIIAADEAVTDAVKALIARITKAGDELPGANRYADLTEQLGYALSDYMPAPRQVGDDPFDS